MVFKRASPPLFSVKSQNDFPPPFSNHIMDASAPPSRPDRSPNNENSAGSVDAIATSPRTQDWVTEDQKRKRKRDDAIAALAQATNLSAESFHRSSLESREGRTSW